MAITSLSSQEFSQDVLTVLSSTNNGPVLITDDGAPTHVLLSFQSYQDLLAQRRNIATLLAMPGVEDIEFNVSPCNILLRKVDLT